MAPLAGGDITYSVASSVGSYVRDSYWLVVESLEFGRLYVIDLEYQIGCYGFAEINPLMTDIFREGFL